MKKLAAATAMAAAVMVTGTLSPASATNIGYEGCTPGYWKNHTENWQETAPHRPVSNLFNVSDALSGVTIGEALRLHGGRGFEGAERILVRAATAAYLNAAHEGVAYPWRRFKDGLDDRTAMVQYVNDALASGDRATIIAAAERLDADNNLGCPL